MRLFSIALLTSCLLLGSLGVVRAQEEAPAAPESAAAPRIQTAFDRPFAIGVYASGWLGAYAAIGGGGRLRWEPFDLLGVEVFGEGHAVEWPGAIRHDHQLGFNLYVPIVLIPEVRLRPLFGFCTVLSMIESNEDHAPRADDVLFGIHAGLGVEWALGTWASVFVDVQATAWMGHDRTARGWTANLGGDYVPYGTVQGLLGVMVHLGD